MARVVIYRAVAKRESTADATRFLRQVLNEMRIQARINLFHGPYTTCDLARSLYIHGPRQLPGRVSGEVGSFSEYALAVEEGAQRHYITPRGNYPLRFYWRKVGREVALWRVNHPGQRGKRYLYRAAETVARRHNMIVVVYDV